jgi:hypothetical protein
VTVAVVEVAEGIYSNVYVVELTAVVMEEVGLFGGELQASNEQPR